MIDEKEDEKESGSIGGGWLGTYAYGGRQRGVPPVRFEATFAAPSGAGRFSGTILDDGDLGEADVSGEQRGQGVQFAKTYRQRGHPTVAYTGTLSDDGRTIQGTWRISTQMRGAWDARRLWSPSDAGAVVEEAQAQDAAPPRELARTG